MKNQVGIIVQSGVKTVYQREGFDQKKWYVAQFGTIRLIVSVDMISKLDPENE